MSSSSAAARTPIGSFQGALASLSAPKLGAIAIKAALERAGLAGDARVGEVYMGCVLPAGIGQAPARQAAIGAGLPDSVGAVTVNKVCGSGLKAVVLGAQRHRRPASTTSSSRAAWSRCPTRPTCCPRRAKGCASGTRRSSTR